MQVVIARKDCIFVFYLIANTNMQMVIAKKKLFYFIWKQIPISVWSLQKYSIFVFYLIENTNMQVIIVTIIFLYFNWKQIPTCNAGDQLTLKKTSSCIGLTSSSQKFKWQYLGNKKELPEICWCQNNNFLGIFISCLLHFLYFLDLWSYFGNEKSSRRSAAVKKIIYNI